jgi:hypothetical protein
MTMGGGCHHCGSKIRDGEPVWRKRVGLGYGRFGRWQSKVAVFCRKCSSGKQYWADPLSKQCEGCGRMVHHIDGRRWRRHSFCSKACELQCQYARLKKHRATARGVSRLCQQCNESFKPTRIITELHDDEGRINALV